MDEDQNKEELTRHFASVEHLATLLEPTLTAVTTLFSNQKRNMELRTNSALLYNSVKLVGDSNILNGLSGEQVKKQLLLKNKSSKRLKFNLLFAFPSEDWHLLEPETNLIDGVYWKENVIIAPSGKYKEKLTVSFPKSLAYQDYIGLIKLEPVDLRLLEE
jgi:hypothetical protein